MQTPLDTTNAVPFAGGVVQIPGRFHRARVLSAAAQLGASGDTSVPVEKTLDPKAAAAQLLGKDELRVCVVHPQAVGSGAEPIVYKLCDGGKSFRPA